MKIFIIGVILILLLGIVSCQPVKETVTIEVPKIVEVTKTVEVPVETIKTIEVEKIVEVPVDVIKEVTKYIEKPLPTFKEVREFILSDYTSRNKFIPNEYECLNFATDVNNNATIAGLKCAIVFLRYPIGQHAIVAFDTIDQGLIFIEPQTDARLDLK
jgi:hypothetical protein